ncbi:SAM-dependent methyltransferase [Streptomyces sp. NPDC004609]|uniref:SAM-dependent methyltransferase n=1 Tax=Streptomyces sp. NPDC004609 TaxID=3364704 RepID=UPI0036835C6D
MPAPGTPAAPDDPAQPPNSVSTARLYSAAQGGPAARDAYQADLDIASQLADLGLDPQVMARENRGFHNRVTHYAACELGIRQVLDAGCGNPAQAGPDTHDILQEIHPDYRVLYADNDPVVVARAAALMVDNRRPTATAAAQADLRDPDQTLRTAHDQLDFDHPVLLLLIAVLHFIPDTDDPHGLVRTLTDGLPPGSAVAISHVTDDFAPETMRRAEALLAGRALQARTRPHHAIAQFFDGLTLIRPGVVPVHHWRQPAPAPALDTDTEQIPPAKVHLYGGLAFKATGWAAL